MAALVTQLLTDAATKPTFTAASVSDTLEYGNGTDWFAVYKNTDGTAKTLTITPVGAQTEYGVNLPAKVLTLPATTGELWVPLRKSYDNGAGTARLTAALDSATGVTVAVLKH